MSLLDDARKMAQVNGPLKIGENCWFCEGTDTYGPPWDFRHDADCPWLSMGAIVAALEVAEQVAKFAYVHAEHTDDDDGHYYQCVWCDAQAVCDCTERRDGWAGIQGAVLRVWPRIQHHEDCKMQALTVALRGEPS